MTATAAPLAHAERHRDRFVADLARFVSFPSVSADPACAKSMRACAAWLAGRLAEAGLERSRVVGTAGHPLVCAEWRKAPGRPTLLVYGHYDVQPAAAGDGWTTPPFTPTIRGDHVYGRGASDDKGQVMAHVAALESWRRAGGAIPVNVVCIIDGEEEIGSPSLLRLLREHGIRAKPDAVVISDTRMLGPGRPALTDALRGGLGIEVELSGPAHDLHSGSYGGAVRNPVEALLRAAGRPARRAGQGHGQGLLRQGRGARLR